MTHDKVEQSLLPVTVEARKAAADLLHEVSILLGDDGIGQVADLIRDGEYDEHDATIAFARFERDILARQSSNAAERGGVGDDETSSLVRLLRALASDCRHTDGWEDGAETCEQAASRLEALASLSTTPATAMSDPIRKALFEALEHSDAIDELLAGKGVPAPDRIGKDAVREALGELWSIVHGCDLRLSVPMETIHKVLAALRPQEGEVSRG